MSEAQTVGHRWPDGSRPYESEPRGWREWVDEGGGVHHLGVDGWCWEHSGDTPSWCAALDGRESREAGA